MLKFEWRYFVRQPSFMVTSLLFFILPYLSVAVEDIQIGSKANIHFNSPHAISETMLIFGFFGIFLVVNFVANTAIRNDITMMSELLYTKPLKSASYQLGRFVGAFLVILTVSLMVPLGLLLGSLMPWVDPERIGEFRLIYYVAPFLLFTLPTGFALSAIFYALAIQFRSMMPVYLCALASIILFSVAGAIFTEPHQQGMMSVVDVFGLTAYFETTQYWTPSQKNSQVVSFANNILLNRVVWVSLGVLILLTLGRIFQPLKLANPKQKMSEEVNRLSLPIDNNIRYRYNKDSSLKQFTTRTAFEVKQVVYSPAFLILLLIAAFMIAMELIDPAGFYGVSNWPLTQYMVELINNSFSLSLLIVITYYTGEVVWRERTTGFGDIIDSMPVHNFIFWSSKLVAVCLVIVSLYSIGMLATLSYQFATAYFQFDLSQYFVSLFYFNALFWIYLAVLAFFIQALSPNKYMGMLIFVGYYFVARNILEHLGLEHNMFNYGRAPYMAYSDMNGYAWFIKTQHYYMLYWGALALVLACFSYAMWQRGPDTHLKSRFNILGYSLGKRGQNLVVFGIVIFISIGTIIHYNTRVMNQFTSTSESIELQVAYEKTFAEYQEDAVPSVISVDMEAAIFPKLRKIEAFATMVLKNTTQQAIPRFLVNYPRNSSIEIQGAYTKDYNPALKTAWLTFDEALAPGDSASFLVKVTRQHFGFKDGDEDFSLLNNGTFINNIELFPTFGINQTRYLSDPHKRRKHQLPEPQRAYLLEDESKYSQSFLGAYIGTIDFKAKLSTSEDQIAIAPGYLKKYWTEGGRNYFIYKMDAPMINFYNIMSANLSVKSARHKGVDIVVYFHKEHKWNVDRMLKASKDALDFYSATFGPYQHEQLRIVEFPGYRRFAQSFANTVPYSEQIGFITDLRDEQAIDPVYYVTAHEVAHQWFGHQLNPANVQGSQILTETLAQYAALQVMQKEYGEVKLRKFLAYELDAYLKGRASEYLEELPLMRAENQDYIHYRKGSVVMMAIADRMGFDALNRAIATLITQFKFSTSQLATTLDLLAAIKAEADIKDYAFIEQQFNQITIYNIRLASASLSENKEQVTLTVIAEQSRANGQGDETEQTFNDWVDVVVFDGDPNNFDVNTSILYRQKHLLQSGENTLTITLPNKENTLKEAKYIGVDPFIRYIDRDSKDNIVRLSH